MTKKQFAVIATAIKAAYPASKVMESDQEMEFWYKMLADLESAVVENAVMEYMCTKKFPPSIAEIRELCIDRMTRGIPSADEAWGTVQTALRRHGHYNPEAAFAMMDDLTASIVKNLGWYNLCMSENPTADRANFRMAYEEKAKEFRERRQLPEFVAQRKLELQEIHIPAIEQASVPKIETVDKPADRKQMSQEEIKERDSQLEELRRRLQHGKEETGKVGTG